MMQLVCNRIALDLYEDTGLQFSKTNPAFAFDAMSAERTTNFKLPATPTNDRVFECAKIPAFNGNAMRKKFDATLIDGVVVMDGFLYVASFDGKDYNAIFVGGLAYDLKKWTNEDWGRLIFNPAYVSDTIYNANAASISTVARVKYHNNGGDIYPSINLSRLFTMLNAQGVFRVSGMQNATLRLIRKDRTDIEGARVRLVNGANAQDLNLDLSTNNQLVTIGQMQMEYDAQQERAYMGDCFEVRDTCYLTFPDDTPANLCVCYASRDGQAPAYSVRFFGSRRFIRQNGQTVYSGAPLAGQTVEIDMTDWNDDLYQFVLMTADGAYWNSNANAFFFCDENYYGSMENVPRYNIEVKMSGSAGGVANLSMLQGLSLGELLKMYAACTGMLINIKRDGSVQFVSDFSGNTIALDEVLEQGEVKRTFADYAQRNRLQYKEGENVNEDERLFAYYLISNDNIEESKDILTLNVSEGGIYTDDYILVRGEEDTLAKASSGEYMVRAPFIKSNLLQSLCDASTQVRVKARMDMYTFSMIDSATGFAYRGNRYSWTEANWSNNVASLTLAKVT